MRLRSKEKIKRTIARGLKGIIRDRSRTDNNLLQVIDGHKLESRRNRRICKIGRKPLPVVNFKVAT
jgi:hypothetical protein